MAFYHSLAYEASAGSGKTFALVIRYISLLYLDAKPSTILALTFTNKAANEMKTRISTVLKELHLPKREAELKEIAKTLECSKEEILSRRGLIYQRYLTSDLKISTIDKFFSQILRLFSQHLGLMPDFTIEEINDKHRFITRFISNIKKSGLYKDLILFSAKESKRLSDIFSFLSYLYSKDAEFSQLEIEKITNDIDEKKILSLVASLRDLFENQCESLSSRAKKTLVVQGVDDLLAKGWICKESFNYWDYRNCYVETMDDLLKEIKVNLALYLRKRETFLLTKYFDLYDLYKDTILQENISENTLSFNDVTNLLFKLLHEKIDSDFLYFRLDSTIEHLLIDEFQDTNIVQYKILEPIIQEIHSGIGSHDFRTFFYVGDIKQSIYRFRGGAKELFRFVQKRFGVTVKELDTNYRSACNLVRFVNETFKNVIKDYSFQKCIGEQNDGYVKVTTHKDLLKSITDEVFDLLQNGVKDEEIAILTYTNQDAFTIEEALLQRDKNLKITTQTSAKLINTHHVRAIIELLKYLYFKEEICRANFLAAIGLHWDTQIDFSALSQFKEPAALIKQIIVKFGFPADANVLKLLEIVGEYKDMEEFLFESENLNIDSPLKKDEGIKILTVHKSKGLEFSYVILADRFKKKSHNRSTMIFSYEDTALENIYIRISKRECVDNSYFQAIENEKRLSYEDDINLLYVAFTRAKNALIICQNEENSAFAPLNLCDMRLGNLVISEDSKKQEPSTAEVSYRSIRLGPQEKKMKTQEKKGENIASINFGNALHYLLEILDNFNMDDLENAYWAMKNRFENLLQDGDAEKIKQRVENLLLNPEFLRLIDGDITKEQPLSFNNELKQIDLLIKKEDHYVIVDYKSSSQIRSEHKSQVRAYKKAVSAITSKNSLGYLCYIKDDAIELISVD